MPTTIDIQQTKGQVQNPPSQANAPTSSVGQSKLAAKAQPASSSAQLRAVIQASRAAMRRGEEVLGIDYSEKYPNGFKILTRPKSAVSSESVAVVSPEPETMNWVVNPIWTSKEKTLKIGSELFQMLFYPKG